MEKEFHLCCNQLAGCWEIRNKKENVLFTGTLAQVEKEIITFTEVNIAEQMTTKMNIVKFEFGNIAERCKIYNDDRKVFYNCYNMLLKTLEDISHIDTHNIEIVCYLQDGINKEYRDLKKLYESLLERDMIKVVTKTV
jgi:hypothetical protein